MNTKEKAMKVLNVMYERGNGSTVQDFNVDEICEELGFSGEDYERVWLFLCNNDYIAGSFGGEASLTVKGAMLVEELREGKNPFEPTPQSVTYNYGPNINIGGDVSNSNIATQGHATVNYIQDAFKTIEENVGAGSDAEELKKLVRAIMKELEEGKVPNGLLERAKRFFANYGWFHGTVLNLLVKWIEAKLHPGN